MRIRQLTAASTVAAATLLLSACGGGPLEGKTGPEVADAAADALEKADSVHMAGEIEQDGEMSSVDIHLQGEDATGTLSFGDIELQLLTVDGVSHLQAAPEFWASFGMPESIAANFDGRWVLVPEDVAGDFSEFSLAGMVDQLRNPESEVKDEVRSEEVDGEDVVVVEQEDGSELTVRDDDPSYPVSIRNDGDSAGTIEFSRFGEKEDISAPEDPIDLTEMMGGS
ncbi:hypothetical protein [Blastococcus sp. LR1]|uniref:hypothetical protein n=1 Tax=Blastococcus sp. LR1 TaxID=2877000 RepID=UPI001CCA716E|nr:hypothetical protein [Blastococcus sp. LR1]MCA0145697.1 hypothetical protein [Blastococcus sp. LR1]